MRLIIASPPPRSNRDDGSGTALTEVKVSAAYSKLRSPQSRHATYMQTEGRTGVTGSKRNMNWLYPPVRGVQPRELDDSARGLGR